MSLDLLMGYTGLVSLGHAAYFAIGAYTTAILSTRYGSGFAVCLFSSIGMSAGLAACIGLFVLRAVGVYFLMITLGIAMCFWGLIFKWNSLTGGENGISAISRPDLGLHLNMLDPVTFYYLMLIIFAICFVLMLLLIQSPFGKTLVGTRDSESRMRVLGYNVWLHKYLAYIIAGGFAGVGGVFYAYFNRFVGADDSSLYRCMEVFLMVSIGGRGTLVGPGIGAFLITFLKNIVSVYTKRWVMVMAVVYMLCAKYTPMGIMGYLKQLQKKGEERYEPDNEKYRSSRLEVPRAD